MSYTEINQKKGMSYGGMPYDAILDKLEETDPELVGEVRGDDAFFDPEDNYDGYARSEIVDWSPDATYLESDHTRRDPALPRTMLNVRYSGGRGPNDYRLPQHPELFIGFTGNDPRGRDTEPRLDKMRAQTVARARNHQVRMGHNVGHGDFIEATRPWGGMAFEYDKKEMQRRLKERLKIFDIQKVGRATGRNVVADEYYGLRQRLLQGRDAAEGLLVPQQDQPGKGWLLSADGRSVPGLNGHGWDPATGLDGGAVRRAGGRRDADSAPWRNVHGDADLEVQRYVAATGGGRETFGPGASGGAQAAAVRADGTLSELRGSEQTAARRDLAASMKEGAQQRRARDRRAAQDTVAGVSAEGRAAGAGLAPGADIGAALRAGSGDQPGSAHERLAAAQAMVRGVREGSAGARRRALDAAVAAGVRGSAVDEGGDGPARGPRGARRRAGDVNGTARQGQASLIRAGAAEGLTVHRYTSAPAPTAGATGGGRLAVESRHLAGGRASRVAPRAGRSKAPEYRGHTQDPAVLGSAPNDTFGDIDEHSEARTGGLALGTKDARPSGGMFRGDDGLGTADFAEGGLGGDDSAALDGVFDGSMIGSEA